MVKAVRLVTQNAFDIILDIWSSILAHCADANGPPKHLYQGTTLLKHFNGTTVNRRPFRNCRGRIWNTAVKVHVPRDLCYYNIRAFDDNGP